MRGIAAKAARGEGCVLACEPHTAQGASTKAVSTTALAAAPCMVANVGAEKRNHATADCATSRTIFERFCGHAIIAA